MGSNKEGGGRDLVLVSRNGFQKLAKAWPEIRAWSLQRSPPCDPPGTTTGLRTVGVNVCGTPGNWPQQ